VGGVCGKSIVSAVIKKAQQALSEAKFFISLERLIPKLDISLPATVIAEHASQLFKLADPKAVISFKESVPKSLMEHDSSAVRAVCARLSRGRQLQESLNDPSKNVRAAALSRLREVGETMPDTAPLVDLSDEYYDSIAQRLVNDFPDRSGDWVSVAVADVVRSYRATSGVALDAKKLKAAVKHRLAEMQDCTDFSCLEESIAAMRELEDEECEPRNDEVTEPPEEDDYVIESARLPKLIQQRMLSEHASVVIDAPRRITFTHRIGHSERAIAGRIARQVETSLRGTSRVKWCVESPDTVLLSYEY